VKLITQICVEVKIKPTLKARFLLDRNGNPKFEHDGDHKHYEIELYVDDAPEDTFAVTYILDESYYDPVVESKKKNASFGEEITSYGDYVIVAKVRARTRTYVIQRSLAKALAEEYDSPPKQSFRVALEDIAVN
jgi:hypothetical protein